jgi:type 1 glutamine amidotransferase
MSGAALVLWGGWPGHDPARWRDLAVGWLEEDGFRVEASGELSCLADRERMEGYDLVVPIWTLGELEPREEEGLSLAVAGGAGLAGWHGAGAAFNDSLLYKWMLGGQMVAHPGDLDASYEVRVVDREHPVTRGLGDFHMTDTELYLMHVDPRNHVLASARTGDGGEMPVAWTRAWGRGRVFYLSIGHAPRDFCVPEAMALARRGWRWAARARVPAGAEVPA